MANFLISRRTRRSSRTTRGVTKKKKLISDSALMGHCKKHPKHRQSPGVCSLCLNEKLSNLSLDHYYDYTSMPRDHETVSSCSSSESSSSSVSSYCSSSVSSCLSPLHHRYREVVSKKKDMKKQGFLFRLLLG